MSDFHKVWVNFANRLLKAEAVDVGSVHAQDISGKPEMISREITQASFVIEIPETIKDAQQTFQPNLPWAEDHFLERVSGQPLNPPPSEQYWPFAQQGNEAHKKDRQFSHTYPERFWPKYAGGWDPKFDDPRFGIRYDYGDLEDVVELLRTNPLTRQAYLPIWFPEDLGAARKGERVPCTLGYHFLYREHTGLDVFYPMRSCDFMRFFVDDVYMACRLAQWVSEHTNLPLGHFNMHIGSLHVFEGDMPLLRKLYHSANSIQLANLMSAF